jgi:hypothetical protein
MTGAFAVPLDAAMLRSLRRPALFAICVSVALPLPAEEPPRFWAVTGVASGDVLHLRDVPSADSKSLMQIPANAHGLKHIGCRRNQPPMELWARMSAAQRRDALTQWCRVEYRGVQGWVAGRFLKRDASPAK